MAVSFSKNQTQRRNKVEVRRAVHGLRKLLFIPRASSLEIRRHVRYGADDLNLTPRSRRRHRYGDVLTDSEGLPLVYDSDSIGRYWDKRPGEVGERRMGRRSWSRVTHVHPQLLLAFFVHCEREGQYAGVDHE